MPLKILEKEWSCGKTGSTKSSSGDIAKGKVGIGWSILSSGQKLRQTTVWHVFGLYGNISCVI